MTEPTHALPASFRDPSGFVFRSGNTLYRQINDSYREQFDRLISSGLYDRLLADGLLIPHRDTDQPAPEPSHAYRVIQPDMVPFISYPSEWCFSQLKDAALATLQIQRTALEHGQSLKDGSAFNIQFVGGRPVLIDTLSFEPYREGHPWVAYRQFCQHFLAPLALMSRCDVRLNTLFRSWIDGVPVDIASTLLPRRTRFSFGLFTHIHLHARSQRRYANETTVKRRRVGKTAFLGLIDNLQGVTRGLRWNPGGTEWGDYYDATNYTDDAMQHKVELVGRLVERVQPRTAWDLGANTGVFSRIAARTAAHTVAFDIDPAAVEKNYLEVKRRHEPGLLPLVMDLTNPTPSMGWAHSERDSLADRGPTDLAMALALVHHLGISNNLPMSMIAGFFARVSKNLIIEFVPKEDSQVRKLLATREDIFDSYHLDGFRNAFSQCFDIEHEEAVKGSHRTLFLLRTRSQ